MLIVVHLFIWVGELDLFQILQLFVSLLNLFHPYWRDLVVPFPENLSIVGLKRLLLDFFVYLLKKLLLHSFGNFFMLEFLFFLQFLKNDFIKLSLVIKLFFSTEQNKLVLLL